ncbi:MAG: YbbR-like domain-containing protein [Oscillospiraceae bacterium]
MDNKAISENAENRGEGKKRKTPADYLKTFWAACRDSGNITTLLFSILAALVVWFAVRVLAFPTTTRTISGVGVEAQVTQYMKDNNLEITSMSDQIVKLELSGKSVDIVGLEAEDFTARLDLSVVRSAGTFPVEVNIYRKDDPNEEADTDDYSPRIVTLVVEEIVTREFEVTADASGISMTDDYYLDTITAAPAVVKITGSVDQLNKITRVEAKAAVNSTVTDSLTFETDIMLYDANGSAISKDDLTLNADKALVTVPVYPKKELPLTFSFAGIPQNFDISSLKYTIQPDSIMVAAPDESIFNLSELNIGTINIADIRFNQTTSTIPITLPDGYKNLSGNNSARITWNIADYGKLDFPATNITVVNEPDNMGVDIITQELTLSVIGPSEQLSALSSGDFYVTANLLGVTLHDGSQDVPVTIVIGGSAGKTCWALGSYKITVSAKTKDAADGV